MRIIEKNSDIHGHILKQKHYLLEIWFLSGNYQLHDCFRTGRPAFIWFIQPVWSHKRRQHSLELKLAVNIQTFQTYSSQSNRMQIANSLKISLNREKSSEIRTNVPINTDN